MTFQEYKSAYWAMPATYRAGDMPTQYEMTDAVDGFIADCAYDLVPGMEICSSSLDSNGLPMDYEETAHKRDEETGECNECGAGPNGCAAPSCLDDAEKGSTMCRVHKDLA